MISVDGTVRKLPGLTHRAGSLDGLLWVGNAGLALAEFGTIGDLHEPKHEDRQPTIAMVDVLHGRILQAVALPVPQDKRFARRPVAIDARVDAKGQIYALFTMPGSYWLEWRQGTGLRRLGLETGVDTDERFTVSPDLKRVLRAPPLAARGSLPEYPQHADPWIPVTGTIADLRDLATGKIMWVLRGTARVIFWPKVKPAISEDGKYALVAMPDEFFSKGKIAVISMRDGHVVQMIGGFPEEPKQVGFGENGKVVWIGGASFVEKYRLLR